MTIKLYIDYISQPSRAVLSLCLINKIPLQVIQTRINKGQNKTPQFAKINPFKKMPAIIDTDNEFALCQSHAIMRYLCRKFKTPLNWYPENSYLQKTAKIDQYLDFHHLNTRLCTSLIFNTMFAKKIGVVDPSFNEQIVKKNVEKALKSVQTVYLSKGKYIVGDQPSIADLSAYFQIQFLFLKDYNFAKWQNINRWMQLMGQIPEIKEVDQIFMKVATKIKKANL